MAQKIGQAFVCLFLLLISIWAVAALYFDVRVPCRCPSCGSSSCTALAQALLGLRGASCLFLIALAWWLSLRSSNDGNWQGDVSRPCLRQANGDHVTIYNTRGRDYRAE
jgi:hypothetical protein